MVEIADADRGLRRGAGRRQPASSSSTTRSTADREDGRGAAARRGASTCRRGRSSAPSSSGSSPASTGPTTTRRVTPCPAPPTSSSRSSTSRPSTSTCSAAPSPTPCCSGCSAARSRRRRWSPAPAPSTRRCRVHSLHSYFLRPGDPRPDRVRRRADRDGRSFSTRRVVARQHGRPIYFMTASFQVPEDGLRAPGRDARGARRPRTARASASCSAPSRRGRRRSGRREWAALELRAVGDSRPGGGCPTTGTRRGPGCGSGSAAGSTTTSSPTRRRSPTPAT